MGRNVTLHVVVMVAYEDVINRALRTIDDELYGNARSSLILTTCSLPDRFRRAFVRGIVRHGFYAEYDDGATAGLVSGYRDLDLIARAVLDLDLRRRSVNVAPSRRIIIRTVLLNDKLIGLVLLRSNAKALRNVEIINDERVCLCDR